MRSQFDAVRPCRRLLSLTGVLVAAMSGGLAQAQESDIEVVSREYQVKAAYLHQFGRYVEWPASAFLGPESPFVIGVLEGDSVAFEMSRAIQTKKIQDRSVEIRRFHASSQDIACHALFLSGAVASDVQRAVLRRVAGRPILLIGEIEGFLSGGGVIGFVVEDNRIRLDIAKKTAERQGLIISSKLLQVAHVVD